MKQGFSLYESSLSVTHNDVSTCSVTGHGTHISTPDSQAGLMKSWANYGRLGAIANLETLGKVVKFD